MSLQVTQLVGFGGFTEAASAGYSFNITSSGQAGSFNKYKGFAQAGNALGMSAIGSIDAEPIVGQVLDLCVYDSFDSLHTHVYFVGNVLSLVTGKTLYIDTVAYSSVVVAWEYTGTHTRLLVAGGTFTNGGGPYFVEIK